MAQFTAGTVAAVGNPARLNVTSGTCKQGGGQAPVVVDIDPVSSLFRRRSILLRLGRFSLVWGAVLVWRRFAASVPFDARLLLFGDGLQAACHLHSLRMLGWFCRLGAFGDVLGLAGEGISGQEAGCDE